MTFDDSQVTANRARGDAAVVRRVPGAERAGIDAAAYGAGAPRPQRLGGKHTRGIPAASLRLSYRINPKRHANYESNAAPAPDTSIE